MKIKIVKIYSHRGLLGQLLFLILMLFAQQRGIPVVRDVLYHKDINYVLALVILLGFFLETIGALRVVPLMHKRYVFDKSDGLIFFGLLMHCVVGLILIMTMIAAISGTGLENIQDTPYKGLMVLILVEVLRNLIIPLWISSRAENPNLQVSPLKEIVGEFFLIFRSVIAYMFTRGAMVTTSSFGLGGSNIGLTILYTILAAIIFWVFYLGTNLVWILLQYEQAETKFQKICFNVFLIVVTIFALYPLYAMPALG